MNMCKAWEDMRAQATRNGEKMGKEIGKEEKAVKVAEKLLRIGSFSNTEIAELTGLPIGKIQQMQ